MSQSTNALPRKPSTRVPDPDRMSVTAYLVQGSAFIAFLLGLFMLAGFRG